MNDADKEKFLSTLNGTSSVYDKALPPNVQALYWNTLKRFEIDEVVSAFSAHVADPDKGQFMPKPADIILQIEGSGESREVVAWGKVTHAMDTAGPYNSVCFDDPRIHVAITAMGGWESICPSEVKDLPFVEKRFREQYRAAKGREGQATKYLPGIHDRENRANGFEGHVEPPRLIGDQDKALALLDAPERKKPVVLELALDPEAAKAARDEVKRMIDEAAKEKAAEILDEARA